MQFAEIEAIILSIRMIDNSFDSESFLDDLLKYSKASTSDILAIARFCFRLRLANKPFPWDELDARKQI